jgi:hypothetical protein
MHRENQGVPPSLIEGRREMAEAAAEYEIAGRRGNALGKAARFSAGIVARVDQGISKAQGRLAVFRLKKEMHQLRSWSTKAGRSVTSSKESSGGWVSSRKRVTRE